MKLLSLILAGALMTTPAMAQNTSTSSSLSQSGAVINQNSHSAQQAPGVGSPGLVSGGLTCAGSASGGISAPGFGISFGSTNVDVDCTRRQYAALLAQMGHSPAAINVVCNNDEVRQALADAGVSCPARGNARATVASQTVPSTVTRNGITAELVVVGNQMVPSVPLRNAPRFYGVEQVMVRR